MVKLKLVHIFKPLDCCPVAKVGLLSFGTANVRGNVKVRADRVNHFLNHVVSYGSTEQSTRSHCSNEQQPPADKEV